MLVNPRGVNFPVEFDSELSLREARSRRPLQTVLQELGHGPRDNESWKSFTCPHCHKKKKCGIFQSTDKSWLFKCHSDSCPSRTGSDALDEVAYLMLASGQSRRDAFESYLKDSGVWEERSKYVAKPASVGEDEDLIVNCIAAVREEQKASVSGLQRRFKFSYGRASRIMDELERRGVVGPSRGSEPREVLEEKISAGPAGPQPGAETAAETVSPGAISLLSLSAPADEAAKMDKPVLPRPVVAAPPANVLPFPARAHAPTAPVPAARESASADGVTALPAPAAGSAVGAGAAGAAPLTREMESGVEPDEETGADALRQFYAQLSLSEQDEALLFHKRGLTTETQRVLGFRSNPKSNLQILQAMMDREDNFSALLSSGLCTRKDRTLRPSGIFYGWGRATKKTAEEIEAAEAKAKGARVNEWNFGWTHQVLIPYFDDQGDLVGLRPHKDMAAGGTVAGTPRLYIPRRGGGRQQQRFYNVVITEGEFKAAALWQTVGEGSGVRDPWGVAAVPGITFAKNMEEASHAVREEMDEWLRAVRCGRVVVAYDNEDKSGKPMAKRHDAEIWARYLAEDLHRKLHITTLVAQLPKEWRDDKGKADWDGALARFVRQGLPETEKPTLEEEDQVPYE